MATEREDVFFEVGYIDVDNDMVLKRFDLWHENVMTLMEKKSALEEKMESILKEKQDLKNKNSILCREFTDMQKVISDIQKQLHRVYVLEGDIETMKAQIELEKNKNEELQQAMKDLEKSHENKITELKKIQVSELETAVASVKQEGQEQTDRLNEIITEKDQTISNLHDQMKKIESEKQAEVLKITLELDSKVAKLQRQKQINAVQSSAATQEIFKKKLQFMKAESEKEIVTLKKTIADLQQKVYSRQREPTTGKLSLANKKRYY